MNYLDRNEFNYAPSQEVVEALKNFDINKLCFYTRIYAAGAVGLWWRRYIETSSPLFPDPRGWEQDDAHS